MSDGIEKIESLIQSGDSDTVNQGLALLDSLKWSPEQRRKVLIFSEREVTFDIEDANLSASDFRNSVVRGTVARCDLSNCDFRGAWIDVAGFSTCRLDEIDCTGAILTDETGFSRMQDIPSHIQTALAAFYPIRQLQGAVEALEDAVEQMGGSYYAPEYEEEFLSTPTKIQAYAEALSIASDVSSLGKRYKAMRFDKHLSRLPALLRNAEPILQGCFDDEGGYLFDGIGMGPSWEGGSQYHRVQTSLLVQGYESFRANVVWTQLNGESTEDVDEFIQWLIENAENGEYYSTELSYPSDENGLVKSITAWTEEEKQHFSKQTEENYELGYSDDCYALYEITSSAFTGYIGGETMWSSWDNIRNSVQ